MKTPDACSWCLMVRMTSSMEKGGSIGDSARAPFAFHVLAVAASISIVGAIGCVIGEDSARVAAPQLMWAGVNTSRCARSVAIDSDELASN